MKAFRLFTILILVATVLLAACGGAATPTPAVVEPTQPPAPTAVPPTQPPAPTEVPPTQAPEPTAAPVEPVETTGLTCDEPIKVGMITDASGPLAVYGAQVLRSFMLGMEYMAGAPGSAGEVFTIDARQNVFKVDDCEIQVFVADDKSNAENTATVARELIEVEQVDILVGTVSSPATATLQGLALENQIPLIVVPAAANDITGVNFNEYTFRVSRNNYQDAINVCEYLTTQYTQFVQIAPDNIFGRGGATAFRDACTNFGGNFVADDIFAPLDTTDFTPYMEQIANAGAEAWIVTWSGGGFIPMFQAAKDLGVTDELAMGTAFIDNLTMPAVFGNAIGQTSGIFYHYTAPNNPLNDYLTEQVKARHGVPPDLFDADGMNAAIFLVESLRATGGDTSAEAMLPAMEGMTFNGPKGEVYIRPEDHVAIQDMYIVKLLNLNDPEFKYYENIETNRPEPPCLLPEALKDRCGDLPYGSLSGQ